MKKYIITIVILSLFVIYLIINAYYRAQKVFDMELAFAMNNAWMEEKEINLKVQAMVDFQVIKLGDVDVKEIHGIGKSSGVEIKGNEKTIAAIKAYIQENIIKYKLLNNNGLNNKYFTFNVIDNPTSIVFEYIPKLHG